MADETRKFSRANRGARMHLLIGEQEEAGGKGTEIRGGDTQIGEMQGEAITYNDYFNESSDEGSYVESSEEEDYVDSDFVTDDDDDEEEDEDAEQDIAMQDKAERKKAKKAAYVDPAKRAARAAKAGDSDSDSDEGAKGAKGKKEKGGKAEPGRSDRSFRSTTQLRSEASKTAAQDAAQRRNEGGKGRGPAEERRLTQAELLEEAKQTAEDNDKDLQRLVRIEEGLKKVVWKKAELTGPRVITFSSKATHTVTFTDPASVPELNWEKAAAPAPPPKAVCAVTGKPAKYKDPKTGQYYATMEAFKKLRASA